MVRLRGRSPMAAVTSTYAVPFARSRMLKVMAADATVPVSPAAGAELDPFAAVELPR